MRYGYPRDVVHAALQASGYNAELALQLLTGDSSAASRVNAGLQDFMTLDILIGSCSALEVVICSAERSGTRAGKWVRHYPEWLLTALGYGCPSQNLDRFRSPPAVPFPDFPCNVLLESALNWAKLSEILPEFCPRLHVTKFKGLDAVHFVQLAAVVKLYAHLKDGLKAGSGHLIDFLIQKGEMDSTPWAPFARKHPEVMLKLFDVNPSLFDVAAIRERRNIV
jgi:hypothetical protein